MSKEEFLKIQTWVLKVYIHCDGCDRDVKKTLGKIAGVLTVKVDKEQNKVTVSGTAAPPLLIKKLKKIGQTCRAFECSEVPQGQP
ncbi:heavy metal-associated isoprenylated plant protein 32 [Eucalyptus grandis]|uniref:heavy metal-associated isoprenylated plant protein 32 n=1 Tax=Eucalyptus grandis TaxID=71139 RepID=UPI00192E84FD|nr:heavy metal-associated isoprenylated plant protein 32 [Eucalyptus grandis]